MRFITVLLALAALCACGKKEETVSAPPAPAPAAAESPSEVAKPSPPPPAEPPPLRQAEPPQPKPDETHAHKRAKKPSDESRAADEAENFTRVAMVFGTDRTIDAATNALAKKFGNGKGRLVYGIAEVSVPRTHALGEIERPRWYKLEFREDPQKHMVLLRADVDDAKAIFRSANELIDQDAKKRAFVFVHGYNVSFHDAALRTAQMAVDLDIHALPTFFSWPSQGATAKYTVDENNVIWTRPHLKEFLLQLADSTRLEEIFVIAHSMGGRATTEALSELLDERADLRPRFVELVLAAPDIDADVFKEQLLPKFRSAHLPVTLYGSSTDKALAASVKINGCCRAGMGGDKIVLGDGMETIDATSVDTDFLGHSYFAENRVLLTDIAILLGHGIRAAKRPTLSGDPTENATHWVFKK